MSAVGPGPAPAKKPKTIHLEPGLADWLEALAARERRSFTAQVELLLEQAREREEEALPAREYDVVGGLLQPDTMREVDAVGIDVAAGKVGKVYLGKRAVRPDPRRKA